MVPECGIVCIDIAAQPLVDSVLTAWMINERSDQANRSALIDERVLFAAFGEHDLALFGELLGGV